MGKKLSKSAKKQLINILVLVALVAITLTVLFLSYRELNFGTILDFLRSSNGWLIGAAFACMVAEIIFEGLSIHVIARRLGHKSKLRASLAYSTSDIYYSAITPSASGGQPASMFYMVRDGMSAGTAGFTLIFNLVAYTGAIIAIGIFALAVRPQMILGLGNGLTGTLIIVGFVVQFVLLGLLIMCMLWSSAVLKAGNGVISLLTKIKIVRKPDKWRGKVAGAVEKYRSCRGIIKTHPALFLWALLLNIGQRVCKLLIPCLVCLAADPSTPLLDLVCMQAYVVIGYNVVPLPGGVGVYEALYSGIYGDFFLKRFAGDAARADAFMFSSMMVSRVISFYICMIVSGIYTLVYHGLGIRKGKDKRLYAEGGRVAWLTTHAARAGTVRRRASASFTAVYRGEHMKKRRADDRVRTEEAGDENHE